MHLWVMWQIWRSWSWFLDIHTNKASNEYLWISCDAPKSLKAKKTKKAFFFLGRVTVFSLVFMLQFTSLGMCTCVHLLLYFARSKSWVVIIIIILLSLLIIYIWPIHLQWFFIQNLKKSPYTGRKKIACKKLRR